MDFITDRENVLRNFLNELNRLTRRIANFIRKHPNERGMKSRCKSFQRERPLQQFFWEELLQHLNSLHNQYRIKLRSLK